ncbi:hypothetical protein EIP86_000445 [Pleurotus ostreatoroseus]|nr:hypothetical protein EIP86_000445 [Pleurotus ostreatoroseus]
MTTDSDTTKVREEAGTNKEDANNKVDESNSSVDSPLSNVTASEATDSGERNCPDGDSNNNQEEPKPRPIETAAYESDHEQVKTTKVTAGEDPTEDEQEPVLDELNKTGGIEPGAASDITEEQVHSATDVADISISITEDARLKEGDNKPTDTRDDENRKQDETHCEQVDQDITADQTTTDNTHTDHKPKDDDSVTPASKDDVAHTDTKHLSDTELNADEQTNRKPKGTRNVPNSKRKTKQPQPQQEDVERNTEGLIAKPTNFSSFRSWKAIPEIDTTKIPSLKRRVQQIRKKKLLKAVTWRNQPEDRIEAFYEAVQTACGDDLAEYEDCWPAEAVTRDSLINQRRRIGGEISEEEYSASPAKTNRVTKHRKAVVTANERKSRERAAKLVKPSRGKTRSELSKPKPKRVVVVDSDSNDERYKKKSTERKKRKEREATPVKTSEDDDVDDDEDEEDDEEEEEEEEGEEDQDEDQEQDADYVAGSDKTFATESNKKKVAPSTRTNKRKRNDSDDYEDGRPTKMDKSTWALETKELKKRKRDELDAQDDGRDAKKKTTAKARSPSNEERTELKDMFDDEDLVELLLDGDICGAKGIQRMSDWGREDLTYLLGTIGLTVFQIGEVMQQARKFAA